MRSARSRGPSAAAHDHTVPVGPPFGSYLNPGWKQGDGGELRVYPFPQARLEHVQQGRGMPVHAVPPVCACRRAAHRHRTHLPAPSACHLLLQAPVDIPPLNDRLVLFSSQHLAHRVLPSMGDRYCLTIWLSAGGRLQAADGGGGGAEREAMRRALASPQPLGELGLAGRGVQGWASATGVAIRRVVSTAPTPRPHSPPCALASHAPSPSTACLAQARRRRGACYCTPSCASTPSSTPTVRSGSAACGRATPRVPRCSRRSKPFGERWPS